MTENISFYFFSFCHIWKKILISTYIKFIQLHIFLIFYLLSSSFSYAAETKCNNAWVNYYEGEFYAEMSRSDMHIFLIYRDKIRNFIESDFHKYVEEVGEFELAAIKNNCDGGGVQAFIGIRHNDSLLIEISMYDYKDVSIISEDYRIECPDNINTNKIVSKLIGLNKRTVLDLVIDLEKYNGR